MVGWGGESQVMRKGGWVRGGSEKSQPGGV